MSYHHTEDIDGSKSFDVNTLDSQMRLVTNRIITAFNKLQDHTPTFRSLTETLFESFLTTHKSIRLLLKEAKTDPDYASDAMSLVREQVEKVFVITLILDDQQKWIPIYFKDDWRRFYEYEILLNDEERKNLQRHQVDKNKQQKIIDVLRDNAKLSKPEVEYIEHRYNKPGTPLPAHLKGSEVPEFPTPGKVKDNMTDKSSEPFLNRWPKEYKHICGYSHVGLDKLQVKSMGVVTNNISDEHKKIFLEREIILPTISISYIATASACTESWKYLRTYDADLSKGDSFLEAIFNFWDSLREQSLLGKVFWNIHAKTILPQIIGQS